MLCLVWSCNSGTEIFEAHKLSNVENLEIVTGYEEYIITIDIEDEK